MKTYGIIKGEIRYFETWDKANAVASGVRAEQCINQYQTLDEQQRQGPRIREYTFGFAIQFGDHGEYLAQE